MTITSEEIAREKQRLPRGWGRFGKTLERLAEISEPDETLLSTCVTVNPSFEHKAWSLEFGLYEMTKATNAVLASTNERLILVATGFGGASRKHQSITYDGLEIVSRAEKEFVLRWQGRAMRFRGGHKDVVPGFLDGLAAHTQAPAA
jgi:hypothetical protein